jgi:hypothetical protein
MENERRTKSPKAGLLLDNPVGAVLRRCVSPCFAGGCASALGVGAQSSAPAALHCSRADFRRQQRAPPRGGQGHGGRHTAAHGSTPDVRVQCAQERRGRMWKCVGVVWRRLGPGAVQQARRIAAAAATRSFGAIKCGGADRKMRAHSDKENGMRLIAFD